MDQISESDSAFSAGGIHPLDLLSVSEDGMVAASLVTGNRVLFWHIGTGDVLSLMPPGEAAIASLELAEDGTLVLRDAAETSRGMAVPALDGYAGASPSRLPLRART